LQKNLVVKLSNQTFTKIANKNFLSSLRLDSKLEKNMQCINFNNNQQKYQNKNKK